MRHHYKPPERGEIKHYGEIYPSSHPVYFSCTLFKIGEIGLAVIQQYYDPETKSTRWSSINQKLADDIYLHPRFLKTFLKRAGRPDENNIYPTMTLRQLMWALRMKPIPKQRWETVFDRRDI